MQSPHMRLWSFSLSLALFLLLVTGFSTTALASPAAPPPGGRQTLGGHEIPALNGLAPLGATDGSQTLHLSISLQLADAAGLKALIEAQNDPQSPLYHQYITPQQFTDHFAPSQADVNTVVSFLKSQGLNVTDVSANRLNIKADGTVAQVEQAFQVQISNYALDGHTVYAPATDPSVPASVAGLILNIGGLDNVAKTHWLGSPQPQPMPAAQSNVDYYQPNDLRTAYDMNSLINVANGAGQTVAFVELDGYLPSDIDTYLSTFNLGSPKYSNVLVDGATGAPTILGGSFEVELDMEVVSAVTPGAAQKVYIGPDNLFSSMYDVVNQIVMDNAARVVTNSWGLCEADAGTAIMQAFDNVFAQGAAQGQAFYSASGDSGAYDCGGDDLGVDFPASDPYVVAVGGTTLNTDSNGSYISETVWACPLDDPSGDCTTRGPHGEGGGGGLSSYFAQPSYQSGPGVSNQYSNGKREVPDVSANASNYSPYLVYCTEPLTGCEAPGWYIAWGTSAAAPLWAGITADVNQYLTGLGKPTLGSASAALYLLFNTAQAYPAYHDITSGNNLFYPATSGYDLATGIGTPDVWNIARDLANNSGVSVSPGVISLTTAPGVNPAPQTITVKNTGYRPYSWSLGSLPSWVSASLTSGTLAPGNQATITLAFHLGSTPQTYTTNLSIQDTNGILPTTPVPIIVAAANVSKTWYFAEGYTGGSFAEYLTLENPNASSTVATVTYLLDQGQASVVKTYTLAANSRTTIYVKDEIGAEKNNSMVVNAPLPIIAERPMYFTYSALPGYTIPGGTDVLGATSLSQQFDFGYIDTTPGHDPYLTFLNPNDTEMHVTIQYFGAAGGDPTTTTRTYPANSRGTINVRTDEGLPAGTYSALVSLDEPGLVERPMYLQDAVTGYTGSADVVGVANPQTDWYFAEGYTNTNFNERYYLSNPNLDSSANATVTFFLSNGTTHATDVTIPAGGQVMVSANTVLGNDVNNSAHVSADLPILAERFMSFNYTSAVGGNQHPNIPGATDVLGTNAPGNLFYFAEGYDGTGFAEYLTIENPSTTQAATVTVVFYPDSGAQPTVRTYTIAASSRFTLFTADVLPDAAFSMMVVSNVAIVAERPMYFNYLNSGQTGGTDVVGYQP